MLGFLVVSPTGCLGPGSCPTIYRFRKIIRIEPPDHDAQDFREISSRCLVTLSPSELAAMALGTVTFELPVEILVE